MEQKKSFAKEAVVVGFALFAVFFGAGNLIFPPFLGLKSGESWFTGFVCFVTADAGLAILTTFAIVFSRGSIDDLLRPLGRIPARILSILTVLCVGPLLAIPRTCATTFELGIVPLLPGLSSWIFSILFFGIVVLLTFRPSSVIDIIGKFLTPALLITLAALVIKGIVSPIGPIGEAEAGYEVAKEGFLAGYQTMDVLGAIPLSLIVLKTVSDKGYLSRSDQFKVMFPAGLIAFAGLFLVYGGLCYLGATTSTLEIYDVNQTGLVVLVTQLLLHYFGVVLLALIVFFACLTTAVGLTSSSADFLSGVMKNKISYRTLIIVICAFSVIISNIGISMIISISAPILSIIYPTLLTQIILSFFSSKIKNVGIYRGAAIGSLLISIPSTLCDLGLPLSFIKKLPLGSIGFAWIIPTVICAIIGGLIMRGRKTA